MSGNIMDIAFSYTNRLRLGQAKGGLDFNGHVIAKLLRAERSEDMPFVRMKSKRGIASSG